MSKVQAMPKPEIAAKAETSNPFGNLSERLTQKRQVVEMAKARLSDAIALEGDASAIGGKLSEAQGEAINVIAKGMIAGLIDKAQATALYGDAYGYAPKADGSPGKTPNKTGNTLRKRSVLLSEAFAIVSGEIAEADYPKWMNGKTVALVAPIVTQWAEGNLSPWQAYKDCTEREKATPVDLPFNEKRWLEIAEALNNPESRQRIAGNPALVAAYDAIAAAWQGEIAF